jgi:hypothetical protein
MARERPGWGVILRRESIWQSPIKGACVGGGQISKVAERARAFEPFAHEPQPATETRQYPWAQGLSRRQSPQWTGRMGAIRLGFEGQGG